MRLLHISDTHFGRRVAGKLSRDAEFDRVIDQIVAIARDQRPDLIVHSGDVFDVALPAASELRRTLALARRLAEVAPFAAIAGNHDFPGLFQVFDEIFDDGSTRAGQAQRVRFVSRPAAGDSDGILTYPAQDGAQSIRVAALPFVHPNRALREFRDTEVASRSYAAMLETVFADLGRGLDQGRDARRDLRVLIAHQYIEGARSSGSERRVAAEDAHAGGVLPQVEYAAIGHIHKPQAIAVPGVTAQYAGSPIQLDFGEEGEEKSVVVVEVNPGRPPKLERIPISAGRLLKTVSGTFDEIAVGAARVGDAYVKALVDIEDGDVFYLRERVAKALPDATVVAAFPRNVVAAVPVIEEAGIEPESREVADDFQEFLRQEGIADGLGESLVGTFSAALASVGEADPAVSAEERALHDAIALTACCPAAGELPASQAGAR